MSFSTVSCRNLNTDLCLVGLYGDEGASYSNMAQCSVSSALSNAWDGKLSSCPSRDSARLPAHRSLFLLDARSSNDYYYATGAGCLNTPCRCHGLRWAMHPLRPRTVLGAAYPPRDRVSRSALIVFDQILPHPCPVFALGQLRANPSPCRHKGVGVSCHNRTSYSPTLFDLTPKTMKRDLLISGALLIATIVAVSWATNRWWGFLCPSDCPDPAAAIRNIALIGGAFFAAVFASWRISIATRQADLAEKRNLSERFQRAAEFLAHEGMESAHIRISGLHALRHLVSDAPEVFALQVADVIDSFMVVKPITRKQFDDLSEFRVAGDTLDFIVETVEKKGLLDAKAVKQLRQDVSDAKKQCSDRMFQAGFNPLFHAH